MEGPIKYKKGTGIQYISGSRKIKSLKTKDSQIKRNPEVPTK